MAIVQMRSWWAVACVGALLCSVTYAQDAGMMQEDSSALENVDLSNISSLKTKFSTCQQELEAAKERFSEKQGDIAALEAKLERLAKVGEESVQRLELERKSSQEVGEEKKELQRQLSELEQRISAERREMNEREESLRKKLQEERDNLETLRKQIEVDEGIIKKLEDDLKEDKYQLRSMDDEAAYFRERVEELEERFRELERHHASSLFPHWMESYANSFVSRVRPALEKGGSILRSMVVKSWDRIQAAWKRYGLPALQKGNQWTLKEFNRSKSAISKQWSVIMAKLPRNATNFVAESWSRIKRASNSKLAHDVSDAFRFCSAALYRHVTIVVSELESLMLRLLEDKPVARPFTRKPWSTALVYAIFIAPIVALVVPMLLTGRKQSPRRQEMPQTPEQKSARKKRFVSGVDVVNIPT